ncbi:MAG: hypothetical protein ACLQVI_18985 [Polyangiaceae bacterium]
MGLLCASGALAAACGELLGLDDINYDVRDSGSASLPDSAPADAPVEATEPDGQVVPSTPATLATGPIGAQAIALDDTRVYWVVGGASGSILSVLKDGGGLTTIASGQASPVDIAVQGTSVYWSVSTGGPDPGCMAMVASTPEGIADGGDAAASCVATSMDQTVRMTLGGASVVLLAQGTAAQSNTEYVGFATPASMYMSAPTNGPSLAVTATSQQVFLGNGNGDHVDSLSLPGLTAAPIACTTNCGSAPSVDMTTDVPLENILWITENGGVFKAPIAVNGSTGAPLAQLPSSLVRMARDASYVYATSQDIGVYAVPLAQVGDGGAFLTLSNDESAQPFGIAADGTNVYWTTTGGLIRTMRAPAP